MGKASTLVPRSRGSVVKLNLSTYSCDCVDMQMVPAKLRRPITSPSLFVSVKQMNWLQLVLYTIQVSPNVCPFDSCRSTDPLLYHFS